MNQSHGHTKNRSTTSTYRSYTCMKTRCYNPKAEHYHLWGGKGIRVCDRWLKSFSNFLEDMGERPAGTTLDRIDSTKNYEPGNCRWADKYTQATNCNNKLKDVKSHKKFCKNGHEYPLTSKRNKDNSRRCLPCERDSWQRRMAKKQKLS